MTEREIALWIKQNLEPVMARAIASNGPSIYSPGWLGAMAQREVGFLIARYARLKIPFKTICELMKGDYGQRSGEPEKQYHGFSFWQLDVNTHLDFIKTGGWKDPYKSCLKAIATLEEKRIYLQNHSPEIMSTAVFQRAITASYNCGAARVCKAIARGLDVDYYTFNKDYSKEVWRYRAIYTSL